MTSEKKPSEKALEFADEWCSRDIREAAFALDALVAEYVADEREACAKVAYRIVSSEMGHGSGMEVADAIRARGKE